MSNEKVNSNDLVLPEAKKKTVNEKVYQELRHSLMVGAFIPGQPISLRKLAESLETSLMPVRESVNRLIAERAFQSTPGRSVVVPVMEKDKLLELIRWRTVLEGAAATEACKKISSEQIDNLKKINEELLNCVEANELQTTLIKNQEFHFELYKASQNSVLLPMIESLWLQCGPFMYFSLVSPTVVWDGTCHELALQGVQENDPVKVRTAIEDDIQYAGNFLLKSHLFGRAAPRPIK